MSQLSSRPGSSPIDGTSFYAFLWREAGVFYKLYGLPRDKETSKAVALEFSGDSES